MLINGNQLHYVPVNRPILWAWTLEDLKMKMLRLSDTSVKAYKKRNGNISLHLNSHLMAISKDMSGYRLTHYLKDIRCYLTLENKEKIELEDISISVNCIYGFETMVYSFRASTVTRYKKITGRVGLLELYYHISFAGHQSEEPEQFELAVPIIKRY